MVVRGGSAIAVMLVTSVPQCCTRWAALQNFSDSPKICRHTANFVDNMGYAELQKQYITA